MDSIAPRLAEKVVLKHWGYLFIIYLFPCLLLDTINFILLILFI